MKKLFVILTIALVFNVKNYSQGEGALRSSTLQQSAMLIGTGQLGVAFPTDEVMGYYFNPAILGYTAKENHASFAFMPGKTDWIGFQGARPTFSNFGFNFGYNLKNSNLELPLTIGIGYLNNKFSFGEFVVTSEYSPESLGKYESYDLYNSFSLGIGIDYYLNINLGLTIKNFESQLGAQYLDGKINKLIADGTMFDFGGLLTVPISKLIYKDKSLALNKSVSIYPKSNFHFGYAIANVGDDIYYVDQSQKDPLTRTARLGYNFQIGFDMKYDKFRINFLDYSFSSEATDILVNQSGSKTKYKSGLGDINFSNNLVKLKSDDDIIVRKGHSFKFLDTFIITSGRIVRINNFLGGQTSGLGISSDGIFKILNNLTENITLKYISEHFKVSYFTAEYEINTDLFINNTINFDEISIHFRGFEI